MEDPLEGGELSQTGADGRSTRLASLRSSVAYIDQRRFNSVAASPGQIKVTQPKGCSPTTTTISAAITDPSGVASAFVLFFHTTIGQVPMTNTGGTTWSATLGPFNGTGDGTADFQIHAEDSLGNPPTAPSPR